MILNDYLKQVGLGGAPADAAQQLQITLLRQWCAHLEVALHDADLPPDVALQIMRSVIYGSVPQRADAELREFVAADYRGHLARCVMSTYSPGGLSDPA